MPILELPNGTIILESKVIMEYVEDAYPNNDEGYSLLPEDPVKRAQLRMISPIAEAFFGNWYPIYMRKAYDEAEYAKLNEAFKKLEDLIEKHGSTTSPYALGTPKPTQIDVHIFSGVTRVLYVQGSALDELVSKHIPWANYPRVLKLVEMFAALPEYQGTLALPR